MPRISNEGPLVDDWYNNHNPMGNGSSTYDVCLRCLPKVKQTPTLLRPYNGDPLDHWEEGCEHPPYDDEGMNYRCAICGKTLDPEKDD